MTISIKRYWLLNGVILVLVSAMAISIIYVILNAQDRKYSDRQRESVEHILAIGGTVVLSDGTILASPNDLRNLPDISAQDVIEIDLLESPGFRVGELEFAERFSALRVLKARTSARRLTVISNLPNLEVIYLHAPRLAALDGFESCENLNTVVIQQSVVTNLDPLRNCKSLQILNMSHSEQLSEIAAIEWLESLEFLILSGCPVTDASPIGQCKRLRVLDLSGTSITNIRPLASLLELRRLYIAGGEITHIDSLGGLGELQVLEIQRTSVSNLGVLGHLAHLEHLNADATQCSDLSPIAGHPSLRELSLDGCPVTDVSALATCKSLETVGLSNTRVSNILPLATCPSIRWIRVDNTMVPETQVQELRSRLPSCRVDFF